MDNGKNDTNKIDDSPDATPDGIDDTNKDDKTGDNKVDDKEDKKDDKTDDNKTDDTNDDKKDDDDEDDEDDDGGISPGQNPGSRNLSAEGGSDAVCFPGTATVQLASGARKMMSELAVGDRVQVSPAQFSEVFMFTHKMAHVQHEFVTLRTAAGPTLSLTSMHYIHSNGALVAAGSVQVGDALELADGSVSRVVEVTVAQLTGLYNPQTVHGSIVVDGVLASTYTAAVRPKAAHAMLAPLRALYHRIAFVTKAGEKGGGGFVQYFPRGGVHEAL